MHHRLGDLLRGSKLGHLLDALQRQNQREHAVRANVSRLTSGEEARSIHVTQAASRFDPQPSEAEP
jgi:hypothetical protein